MDVELVLPVRGWIDWFDAKDIICDLDSLKSEACLVQPCVAPAGISMLKRAGGDRRIEVREYELDSSDILPELKWSVVLISLWKLGIK